MNVNHSVTFAVIVKNEPSLLNEVHSYKETKFQKIICILISMSLSVKTGKKIFQSQLNKPFIYAILTTITDITQCSELKLTQADSTTHE